jgi:4-coumarate--CoA ligase (photoactive yellow protein activation family)
MSPVKHAPFAWWRDDAVLHRFVCDLISAELARARPTAPASHSSTWDASLHLPRDLGLDSLEIVTLATALTEAIHLHESGIEDRLLARPTIGNWVATARDGLEVFSAAMTFRTSGSQGDPKRCTHELSTLWQEVQELAPLFAGRRRVLSAVRGHHIYGFLFTVLMPGPGALALSDASVVDLRHRVPTSLHSELRDGDLVIGHPDFWRSVARVGAVPAGVVGVTSTAHCPAELAHQLSRAGLDSLVQIYGSSEMAGVGMRTDPEEPYALMSFWERTADDAEILVRRAPDGRRMPYPLQDTLEWYDERHFRPAGRIDQAIQVAGVNVFPSRVRQVLMEHAAVLDAAVRRLYADDASRLKAFMVLRAGFTGDDALHAELEAWVATHLTAPERPKAFTFGATLPRDAAGKLTDWRVERWERAEP